jgi:hypothetical protein
MASERCAGCFGTGKGVNGGSCTFCAGTGSIWVPDKIDYSSNTRFGKGRRRHNKGPSWLDNAFEDNLAEISFIAVWGWIIYKGLKNSETKWYIPVIIGFVVGYIVYKLLSGPLRPIGTILKYVFYLGMLAMVIYAVYSVIIVL